MRRKIRGIVKIILSVTIIINLVVLTSCSNNEEKNDSVGSGPTIEDMGDANNDKSKAKVVEDAIEMSEKIIKSLGSIELVEKSSVFINHEAVLVAVRLRDEGLLTDQLRESIEEKVYNLYPEAKTIAISNDEYVYESISKLLKCYKENSPIKELLRDLEEILRESL